MSKTYIFPLVNLVLIPGNIVGMIINDEKLLSNLASNMKFIASLVKDEKNFSISDFGCLCEIIGIQKISSNTFIIQMKASKRVKIKNIQFDDIYPFTQNYQILEEKNEDSEKNEIVDKIINLSQNYIPQMNNESVKKSIKEKKLCALTDIIVSIMKLNSKIKQKFLEEVDCEKRALKLIEILEDIQKRWPGKIITLKKFIPKPLTITIFLT